jgi:hypothetical protein
MADMRLTKRETAVLCIAGIFAVLFIFIPQTILDKWEIPYLILVVAPIGFWLALDPERRKS